MDANKSEFRVGDYTLKPDNISSFLMPFRRDKEPVPKPLQGRWISPSDFRKAAQDHHGADYSVEGLRGRNKRSGETNALIDSEGVEVSPNGS